MQLMQDSQNLQSDLQGHEMTEPKRMMTPDDWNPRRVLVTGYYDGPTEGIIDLGGNVGVFCFEEVAFDNDRQTRVSKLSPVPVEQLESIIAALSSALGSPKWPFWMPLWRFEDENVRREIEAELDALCTTTEATTAVLTDDTLKKCFAVRRLDEHLPSAGSDWLALFDDVRK